MGISLLINGSGTIPLIPSPTPIPTSPVPTVTPANNITPTVSPTVSPTASPTVSPTLTTPSTSFSLSGAVSRTIDMGYFTQGTDYGHTSSFRDSSGVTWEGMPLWFLAGMVDDTNQHGPGCIQRCTCSPGLLHYGNRARCTRSPLTAKPFPGAMHTSWQAQKRGRHRSNGPRCSGPACG